MILTSIAFAGTVLLGSSRLAAARAQTIRLQDTLTRTGYLKLPPGKTEVLGLKIPMNGVIEGSGGELDCPSGYDGPAITCQEPGFRVLNVTIRGFSTGILVDAKQPPDGTGESMISGCRVYDYVGGVGIDWRALSDGYISQTVVANTVGSKGGSPVPQYKSGAITTHTAQAAIKLGSGAGGVTVSECHTWGNNLFDIADYAPDSILANDRLEGGRDAHLLLAAFRIQVDGGRIWDTMQGTISAAIQLGVVSDDKSNPFKQSASYCILRQVAIGGEGTMPGGLLRFVQEGHNRISLLIPGPSVSSRKLAGHHPGDVITVDEMSL